LKNKIFKAKYETFEFVTADLFLVSGGFLAGTNYIDPNISTPTGTLLVGIGLFLGLRVLWKFSSDLKNTQTQVNEATKNLRKTNEDVKVNTQLLNDANKSLIKTQQDLRITKKELQDTKKELQKALEQLNDTKEKIFGYGGSAYARSSGFNSLDRSVNDLKRDVDKLKEERDRAKRGW